MNVQNLNKFIHSVASLTMIASDTAALEGFDDLAENLYNIACDLYNEAANLIPD